MSEKRRLEIAGKVMYIEKDLLDGLGEELHMFVRKFHRNPHAIVLGPKEYLALCLHYEKESGQFPAVGMQIVFMNVPVMASQRPGWAFIIPAGLLPLLVPGIMGKAVAATDDVRVT